MELRKLAPFNWLRNERPGRDAGDSGSLANLHQQIDHLFDQAFRGYGFPSLFENEFGSTGLFKPDLDIAENRDHYTIRVEMPGVSKDDVNVEVNGDALSISGEKKAEKTDEQESWHYVERSFGSFQRVLAIPEDADADKIDAGFRDGVLTITLPRRADAESTRRKITVN
jgi:HSP20 family protein